MPRVICKLKYASTLIDGVAFERHGEHVISADVSEEKAKRFTSITGFALADGPDSEILALTVQAEDLGIKVDSRWKAQRLAAEIKKVVEAREFAENQRTLTLQSASNSASDGDDSETE